MNHKPHPFKKPSILAVKTPYVIIKENVSQKRCIMMQKVIVVGAGILGASTAYHLAKSGVNVTIVDRQDKGQATDAAAGIVCPWLSQRRNKAWYQLVKGGARYYPELVKELESDGQFDTGYRKVGAISLHSDEDKIEKMVERAKKRREDAPEIGEIKRLTPTETKKLFPAISDEYGSVFVSGGARVNGRKLRNALINGAIKHGATFIRGNAGLVQENNTIVGVTVRNAKYLADQVIVTAGAWAHDLLKSIHVHFMVTHQKAQILHLELENQQTENWPVIMPPNDQYILSFENGRIIVGATHEDEDGFDHRVTAGGLQEILQKALLVAPGLADGTVVETRVGFRPFTPGFLPVFGPIPGINGMLVANGLGASGLTAGPYLGAELAKLALGKALELEIERYDVGQAIE